ncbi:COX15/CtaA family protein [Mucilaginibacter sp. RS28]|uniref:COX15/CtaA family protein n=1 Tax=Mucilaginibacter straminoryzae TaxID=2932774 RepID=A0A9X1X4R6_9SPHI|nr:COX15/CtaA family protein [Mucilaginibacter straminoryzae]MCJ8208624.1 COX15/CtaA family protein [Mucilaginibacter straminoryzae]
MIKRRYRSNSEKGRRAVNTWLIAGAAMLAIQIVLGGITRLTGSGLSITEWKPLLGALPPLNEQSWQNSFHQYQQIAQFKKINYQFTLTDYKHIFLWEWLHREWARLIALVFALPFLLFVVRGWINRRLGINLFILFLLGALQGLIGWVMVKTGLNDTATTVNPVALAVHFISAMLLFSYLVVITTRRFNLRSGAGTRSLRTQNLNSLLLILLFVQLVFGALMSGSHAALYAPTWPAINGQWIPWEAMTQASQTKPLNPFVIQFVHRGLAYLIAILVLISFFTQRKSGGDKKTALIHALPLALVTIQVALGVLTLLNSPSGQLIYYAALHQLTAILLLASILVNQSLSVGKRTISTVKLNRYRQLS